MSTTYYREILFRPLLSSRWAIPIAAVIRQGGVEHVIVATCLPTTVYSGVDERGVCLVTAFLKQLEEVCGSKGDNFSCFDSIFHLNGNLCFDLGGVRELPPGCELSWISVNVLPSLQRQQ